MLQDLQLAGETERTQESYLRAEKFAQWLDKSPDQASENDLRRYLLFIKNDQQWEGKTLRVAYSGLGRSIPGEPRWFDRSENANGQVYCCLDFTTIEAGTKGGLDTIRSAFPPVRLGLQWRSKHALRQAAEIGNRL